MEAQRLFFVVGTGFAYLVRLSVIAVYGMIRRFSEIGVGQTPLCAHHARMHTFLMS
jgi:hypothetical protein